MHRLRNGFRSAILDGSMASPESDTLDIPARTLLRAAEVCQMAGLQPYVLRSWEAEFPSLGVARAPGGDRVYRRRDVERVLEIKQLVFTEGLTLAGVRRRLGESAVERDGDLPDLSDVLGAEVKAQVDTVKSGLRDLLVLLSDEGRRPRAMSDAPDGDAKSAAKSPKTVKGSRATRKKKQ